MASLLDDWGGRLRWPGHGSPHSGSEQLKALVKSCSHADPAPETKALLINLHEEATGETVAQTQFDDANKLDGLKYDVEELN